MASGKTLLMRNIRRPAPAVIHRHIGVPRWVRRNRRLLAEWKGSYVENVPYVSNDRHLKKERQKERARARRS